MEELLARTENDRDLLSELLSIFVDEFPAKLAEVREALSCGDLPRVAIASHALKGMLANLAIAGAASAAAQLEKAARAGQPGFAERGFAALERETQGLLPELQAHIEEAQP
jgi:HPt (histidine-containing phosphotransfer) domain-containing protein